MGVTLIDGTLSLALFHGRHPMAGSYRCQQLNVNDFPGGPNGLRGFVLARVKWHEVAHLSNSRICCNFSLTSPVMAAIDLPEDAQNAGYSVRVPEEVSMIPKTMKACQLVAFNKNEIRELPVPEPSENEVLCRIRAIAICGTDPEIIAGKLQKKMGWPPVFPFTLGHEWSGEVVKVGPRVKGFKVGDRVAGEAHCGCGSCTNCMTGNYTLCLNYGDASSGHRHYGFVTPGANADYNVYAPKALHRIPDNLSFRHAALLDTAGVALHGIDMIGVTPGGAAAIWGPGPIGLMSLQMIKAMGAKTIIVVGRRHRLKIAGELGATHLVDYEKCDPVKEVLAITGGAGVDEIQECSGATVALDQCLAAVRKGGKINLLGFYDDADMAPPPITKIVMNQITITGSRANPNVSDRVLNMFAAGLIAGDKVVTHAFPVESYDKALDTFLTRSDGAIKVVVEP